MDTVGKAEGSANPALLPLQNRLGIAIRNIPIGAR